MKAIAFDSRSRNSVLSEGLATGPPRSRTEKIMLALSFEYGLGCDFCHNSFRVEVAT